MSIVIRCGQCGALLKFRDDALGKKARCTKCQSVLQVVPDVESRTTEPDASDEGESFANHLADAAATGAVVSVLSERGIPDHGIKFAF